MKYKPWTLRISDAWDSLNEENNENLFCEKWSEFLQSEQGHILVPNWHREFSNAELYFERSDANDFEETLVEGEREEWMHLADLCLNSDDSQLNDVSEADINYWQSFRENYSEEQIGDMVNWLDRKKAECVNDSEETFELNVKSLNEAQKKAFDMIVENEKEKDKQLLMMVTGLAGCGKSYVINNIRALLKEKCLVTAYFGIAAFNIKGKTLHSLLNLPIRGRNCHDLKGDALSNLQNKLDGVKYIIIDEYSVVGQNLLGWINKRCRQGKGEPDKPFGGLSIIW